MPVLVLVLTTTFCTIASQMILKGAVGPIVQTWRSEGALAFLWAAMTSPGVIVALAIQAFGFLVWFFVIAQSKLSTAFATSGAILYITTALISWLIYGERLTSLQWVGLILVSAGVYLLQASSK